MDSIPAFSYVLPTRIEFGRGVSATLPQELEGLQIQRALFVSDAGVAAAGLLEAPCREARAQLEGFHLFDRVEPNPRAETVQKAAQAALEVKAQAVVAIGGGSVIDLAKAACVLVTHGGKIRDYEGRGQVPGAVLPLIAVPTTAGTGSEVTFSSVITDQEEKIKFSVNSRYLAPRVALLDPDLTLTLPPDLTAGTGMDALTHAIEGLTATKSNPISDVLALEAIRLIWRSLRAAYDAGQDIQARSDLLLGSLLAGMSFCNSDVGGVHCMAESLGALYDAPHGLANSIFLPHVLEFNAPSIPGKLKATALAMGLKVGSAEEASREVVAEIRKLSRHMDIPVLAELGGKEEDLDRLAHTAWVNGSTDSNPRPATREDFLELFRKALSEQR